MNTATAIAPLALQIATTVAAARVNVVEADDARFDFKCTILRDATAFQIDARSDAARQMFPAYLKSEGAVGAEMNVPAFVEFMTAATRAGLTVGVR